MNYFDELSLIMNKVDSKEKIPISFNEPKKLFTTGSAPCFITKMTPVQLQKANFKAKERFLKFKKYYLLNE